MNKWFFSFTFSAFEFFFFFWLIFGALEIVLPCKLKKKKQILLECTNKKMKSKVSIPEYWFIFITTYVDIYWQRWCSQVVHACGNGLAPRSSLVLSRLSWSWQVQTQLQKSGLRMWIILILDKRPSALWLIKPLPKPYAFHVRLWALHFLQAWSRFFLL